ncbi:MAG: DUF1858 domain-containing protein [Eubacterium sp.]|nr:DUF1858 domain-containing protein [Eubacterium sp.]
MEEEVKIYATPDMPINDLLQAHPEAFMALLECGMGCVSCPSAAVETIAEACMVHGLDVDDVIDYVNHSLTEKDRKNAPNEAGAATASGDKFADSIYARAKAAGVGSDKPLEKDMEEKMMDFLDAETYADRIRIFEDMRGADERILNNIAVSMDITLSDDEDNYDRIYSELIFRKKFETTRGDRL